MTDERIIRDIPMWRKELDPAPRPPCRRECQYCGECLDAYLDDGDDAQSRPPGPPETLTESNPERPSADEWIAQLEPLPPDFVAESGERMMEFYRAIFGGPKAWEEDNPPPDGGGG